MSGCDSFCSGPDQKGGCQMRRTLTGYGIAVVIVLAALNGITWLVGKPRLHDLNVFSAGFFRSERWMSNAAHTYRLRDRRRNRSCCTQRHYMVSRKATAT